MRLVRLDAIHARIPLRRDVKHASHARRENDTLLIAATLDDGIVGWGEALPRLYVTGETIKSCFEVLGALDWSQLSEDFESLAAAVARCREMRLPPPPLGERECFGNAVRCAVELAVLDAVSRAEGVPLSHVVEHVPEATPLRRTAPFVRYSVAIMSVKPWKEAASALAYRLYGFEQCKVKVGVSGQDELASLRRIRRFAGSRMDVRVDANEAWPPDDVERRVASLKPFGITAIEQPVSHAQVNALANVRRQIDVPIMLDESLCSLADADRAIERGLCDLFNIRLSKCGGFINSLLLAAKARDAGLGFQLGCMVGETGILSAAGRHFACWVDGLRYLEGSFDRYLIAERLTREDLTFGKGGLAPALARPGLGVTIDEHAIERVTVGTESFTFH
jgi:muconate cycloisomerase